MVILLIFLLKYILLIDDQYLSWGHLIPIDGDFINLTSPFNLIRQRFLLNPIEIQRGVRWITGGLIIIILGLYEKNRCSVDN